MTDMESKVNRELDRAVFKGMRHASPHHAELVFETGGKTIELRVNADWTAPAGPVLDFVLVERTLSARSQADDMREFERGYHERGSRATYHGRFARCPDCGNATVGLAPPYAINHGEECAAPMMLPPREERKA